MPRVFPECPGSKASHRTSTSIGECRPKGIDGATGSSGRLRGLLPIKETTSHSPRPPPLAPRNAFGARQTRSSPSQTEGAPTPTRHGARGLTSAAGAWPRHSHTGNPWRGRGSNPTPLLRGGSRRRRFLALRSKAGWRNCSSSSTPRMRIEDGPRPARGKAGRRDRTSAFDMESSTRGSALPLGPGQGVPCLCSACAASESSANRGRRWCHLDDIHPHPLRPCLLHMAFEGKNIKNLASPPASACQCGCLARA